MPTTADPDRLDRNALVRLANIAGVAEELGVDVCHVRRLLHERRIPYIKWGHYIRFDPSEVRAWIDENRQRPIRPMGGR